MLDAKAVMKGGLRQQAQADWFVFSDARAETAFLLHLSKQTHWTSARLRFIVGAMWLTAIGRFTYAFLWEHHPRSYGWASSRDNTKYRRCSRQPLRHKHHGFGRCAVHPTRSYGTFSSLHSTS